MILAGRGLAAASVAISPAPFRGVAPAADPGAAHGQRRPAQPANWNRAVPLSYEQFRYSFGNEVGEDEAKETVPRLLRPLVLAEPLFQAASANLNPWSEAQVNSTKPGAGSDADHLSQLGPYGPVGDRERGVQEAEAQPGRDRDRQDAGPRTLADNRCRLAGGRREGARVRRAIHNDHGKNGVKHRRTPMNSETAMYKQEMVAPAKTYVNRDASQTRLIAGVSVPDGPLITTVIEHAQRLFRTVSVQSRDAFVAVR